VRENITFNGFVLTDWFVVHKGANSYRKRDYFSRFLATFLPVTEKRGWTGVING
jgi:hypothetical protein